MGLRAPRPAKARRPNKKSYGRTSETPARVNFTGIGCRIKCLIVMAISSESMPAGLQSRVCPSLRPNRSSAGRNSKAYTLHFRSFDRALSVTGMANSSSECFGCAGPSTKMNQFVVCPAPAFSSSRRRPHHRQGTDVRACHQEVAVADAFVDKIRSDACAALSSPRYTREANRGQAPPGDPRRYARLARRDKVS